MKKLGFLLLACIAFSCSKKYKLKATAEGVADSTQVYLKKMDDNYKQVTVDTTQIQNGTFVFEDTISGPEMYFITIEKIRGNLPVILEKGTVKLIVYKDSINKSERSGTTNNDVFTAFIKDGETFQKQSRDAQIKYREARQNGDSLEMQKIQDTFKEIQLALEEFPENYIKNNPDSFVSVLILENMVFAKRGTFEENKKLYEAFSEENKNTKSGKRIVTKLEELSKTNVGGIAPDFKAPTPQGDTLSLNTVKTGAKVTLIDFWAGWCKPCRIENPNLVKLYDKYHNKGFDIIGVSLDKTKEQWTKAIAEDSLSWSQISNLKHWRDPIASTYGVREIPAGFLLDKNGIIVAKNIKADSIETHLKKLLDKEM